MKDEKITRFTSLTKDEKRIISRDYYRKRSKCRTSEETECRICNKTCRSYKSVIYHLNRAHPTQDHKEYYDLYHKEMHEGHCSVCSKPTEFISPGAGYKETCSRSCGAILFRKKLKSDSTKFEQFKRRVSHNQEKIWETRTDEEIKEINSKSPNSGQRGCMKGRFTPLNPGKYKGNVNAITYRSSWEFKVMSMIDTDPNVIWWSSEELSITYFSPIDGKTHRYFPDVILAKKVNGVIKKYVVEIKPSHESPLHARPPTRKFRQRQSTYIKKAKTYETNKSKWEAARQWCKKHGYEFQVITEQEMKSFSIGKQRKF